MVMMMGEGRCVRWRNGPGRPSPGGLDGVTWVDIGWHPVWGHLERHGRLAARRPPNEEFVHAQRTHVRVLTAEDLLDLWHNPLGSVAPVVVLDREHVDTPRAAAERPAAEDLQLVAFHVDADVVDRLGCVRVILLQQRQRRHSGHAEHATHRPKRLGTRVVERCCQAREAAIRNIYHGE